MNPPFINPRRKINRAFSYGFLFFAGIAVAISLGGTVLAADGPKAGIARSPQDDPFEVPGSFKDLPDAKDAVTAKRLPEQIRLLTTSDTTLNQIVIDAEKVTAPAGKSFGDRTIERVTTAGAGDISGGDAFAEADLVDFHATAYCLKGRTASGVDTRPGMIAADPRVLPLGTVVHLRAGRYTGTYTVMDTGGRIRGNIVDVYVTTHREAMEFGRRQVKIKVLSRTASKARRDGKTLLASER